jgi:branched-chain amino acid transport system substrate-binding protein
MARNMKGRMNKTAIIVLTGCLWGCGDSASTSQSNGGDAGANPKVRGVTDSEIVLGSHTDLSGSLAIWGVGATNGARMRFDEANEAGGVHGRQIRFVVEDSQYQVPRAIQAANKLIHRDQIFAMVTALGTPTNNAVMTQQFDAGVPNLFPISGSRSMVEPLHEFKFTQRGVYYDEMRAGVKYFLEEHGRTTPCVVYQDTDYGQEIFEGVVDQLAAMGREVAASSSHRPTENEFTAAILRLRNADCDLVFMGTVHRDTILILDSARKMGWEGIAWVGNNAAYGQVIANSDSAEGYYAFVHIAKLYADDELALPVRQWWDRYEARFGGAPDLYAMEAYRGADITVLALEAAGRDLTTASLLRALEGMSDYVGPFGHRLSFGPDKHKGATESVLSQVQNGRWVPLAKSISY